MPESEAAPLKLVQVGAGGMGRAWLGTIAANPDVELVGLVDLDLVAARQAATDHGFVDLEVATSLDELGVLSQADAVVNVTVPVAHHPINVEALFAGLPVLCEKPFAESLPECLSMVAAAEATEKLIMVSQSRRYFRNLDAYGRQIEQVGPIGSLTCEFFKAPRFGGFRDEMAEPLLIDMAIHQFDLARKLLDAEPVSVYCESFNPSWSWYAGSAAADAIFQFDNGARFAFNGSWCSTGQETSWNGSWRASGPGGTALWDGDNLPLAETAEGEAVPAVIGDEQEQIAGSLVEFVSAVRTGGTPQSVGRSNVLSVAMVAAAVASSASGGRIDIAEVIDDAYTEAVRTEKRPEIKAVLESWTSVREIVGLSR